MAAPVDYAAAYTLAGKKSVVTGSTQGIGRCVAEQMLAVGASVLINARTASDVDATVAELSAAYPGKVVGAACDTSSREGRAALLAAVVEAWGGSVDVLVNNVGVNVRQKIEELPEEDFVRMFRTNVDSCYFLCKAFLPALKASKGCVVNVGSVAGLCSSGTGTCYAMTKGAMTAMTRNLACEWGRFGIRVNLCAPWMTRTPLLVAAYGDMMDEKLGQVEEWTPLGRIAEPHEVAGAVVFLAMPAAAYVTGAALACDGGLTVQAFAGPCTTE